MVYLTRREQFNAAHRLFQKGWSDEKNREVYGPCSNPNWHGHNYQLFVTVKGEVNAELGLVADLKKISTLIKQYVINKIDHKNINLEVDFMKGKIASTENLAIAIWGELEAPLHELKVDLHCIKIVETENNFFEYYGN
ncbi:MAG: 6-carboxytetrahydropterin synthase [Bacteroidota bacterium]|nr:6-carboxytetrahydropterin synthase [Bacteroidota bacterium]MDP4225081.1 6-carboxytetrahydropterin synthase [Bacteroidota bacterium]MDP4275090.1 6-carboxytetrahydropterin synthase [Bacteroidota bacterium]